MLAIQPKPVHWLIWCMTNRGSVPLLHHYQSQLPANAGLVAALLLSFSQISSATPAFVPVLALAFAALVLTFALAAFVFISFALQCWLLVCELCV